MIFPYKNIDYKKEIAELQNAIEKHLTADEIIENLKQELVHIKEKDILQYTLRIFLEIQYRYESDIFKNLRSPYTAGLYLIDLYIILYQIVATPSL